MAYSCCFKTSTEEDREFSDLLYKRYKEIGEEFKEIVCECGTFRYYQTDICHSKEYIRIKIMIQVGQYRVMFDSKENRMIIGTRDENVIDIREATVKIFKNKKVLKNGFLGEYGKTIRIVIGNETNDFLLIKCDIDMNEQKVLKECIINLNEFWIKKSTWNENNNFLLLIQ